MDIATLDQTRITNPAAQPTADGFSALGSQEFFQLILADLLNQDPLKPTDNTKLLEQIALIRDIEMKNEVTGAMHSLVDQQRFGSAAALIGQFVEGRVADGVASGMVAGIRFDDSGAPFLMLDGGRELPLASLTTVTSLDQLSRMLVGQLVTAQLNDGDQTKEVEGVVTGVETVSGTIMLELDTGVQVPLAAVIERRNPAAQ